MQNEDVTMQDVTSLPRAHSPALRTASVPPAGTYIPSVGCVYHSEMLLHDDSCRDPNDYSPHPESPERTLRIWRLFKQERLLHRMYLLPVRPVHKYEVLLVHSQDHWDRVQALQFLSDQALADSAAYYESLSLYVSPHSTRAARLACGGVIEACLSVARGSLQKAVAVVRPPGHHAEPELHMGFCFYNNVAVAARVVQEQVKLKRILIVDWFVFSSGKL